MRSLALVCTAVALAVTAASPALAVTIEARTLILDEENPGRKKFGKLRWLGGLVLSTPADFFGGYSGLAVSPDGSTLLALSDRTSWLVMRLSEHDDRPIGVRDARMGKLRLADDFGMPGTERELADSEALATLFPDRIEGLYLIAFEGRHRIQTYKFNGDTFFGPMAPRNLPPEARRLPGNKGLEALTVLRTGPYKGRALAFSELPAHRSGDSLGWLFLNEKVEQLRLKRIGKFDITGLATLPDGDVVVLERHFAGLLQGVFMRIRRIDAADIKPGARLEGEVLYETENGRMVDNMEAIAAHRDENGRIILTIMSDDNYNPLQRTLLLRFALDREE